MSVKEIGVDIGEGKTFLVKLAYQPLEQKDFLDLLGKKIVLPYIFVTMFSKEDRAQVAFGDARDHREFLQAIKTDAGEIKNWQHGQVCVGENKKICLVNFHYSSGKNDVKNIEQIGLLFNAISPELLNPQEVIVRYGGGKEYIYFPATKKVIEPGRWF